MSTRRCSRSSSRSWRSRPPSCAPSCSRRARAGADILRPFMSPPTPPSKKEVMLALLDRAEARVHLDARHAEVRLPERFRGEPHLRLDYGYGFEPPIPDLTIDDEGISATLSFNRQPY